MDVKSIGSYQTSAAGAQTAAAPPVSAEQNANTAARQDEALVYEKSAAYTPDATKVREMWSAHEAKVDSFRRLVETLFTKQGEKAGNAQGFGRGPLWRGPMVEISDEVRTAAQKEIEEGGYYSVDETAKRILNFAVALSGGDPGKVDLLRGAAMKGFAAAEKVWGGKMPEITQKTMEAVQNGFDEWAAAGSASAISLLKQ